MIQDDSLRSPCDRSIRRSVAQRWAIHETGRIGRPVDKRDFLPRFRPTIAGPLQERVMKDDELLPRPAFGLVVLTPRGVQEGLGHHDRLAERTSESADEAKLRDADEHVRAHRRAKASLAVFECAFWSIQQVLSWITYRDALQIKTPYRLGTLYPTMLGVPKAIENASATQLRQALQRSKSTLVCFREGKEIHGSEWADVGDVNDVRRWPQGVVARESVLREWPALPTIEGQVSPSIEPTLQDTGVYVSKLVTKAKGRPKGSGSNKKGDLILAQEVVERVNNGESQKLVLHEVAERAAGSGTLDSRAKRIERHLQEVRETKPNAD